MILKPFVLGFWELGLILVTKWVLSDRKVKTNVLYGITLIFLSVVILACGFLNFGLSLIFCLVYFPVALLKASPQSRVVALLCSGFLLTFSPCGLLLFANLVPSLKSFSAFILQNVFSWNHGLPFVFVQPLISILAACISTSRKQRGTEKEKMT